MIKNTNTVVLLLGPQATILATACSTPTISRQNKIIKTWKQKEESGGTDYRKK